MVYDSTGGTNTPIRETALLFPPVVNLWLGWVHGGGGVQVHDFEADALILEQLIREH